MAFGWVRSPRYSPLRSNDLESKDPESPSRASSSPKTWMYSRWMRAFFLFAVLSIVFSALSLFTDVPARIQDLSLQDIYRGSKDGISRIDPDGLETQPTHSEASQSATATQVSSTEGSNAGNGQPKETGNEPEVTTGIPSVSETKPKSPVKQPSEIGNEPIVNSQQSKGKPDTKSGDKPIQVQGAEDVDWSTFAYVQYVTNSNYLCNSLMILEALHRLGVKAERIMMYPHQWSIPKKGQAETEEGRFLLQARDQYRAKLVPIEVVTFDRGDQTWKDSYTKLLAFNQTQYKRVISLDSDAIVQQTMDELFLLPPTPIAMPRAYWLSQPFLSSQLLVLTPSFTEWTRLSRYMASHPDAGFDMDILNTLYKDTALVLPHRGYDLLTSEFRHNRTDHARYLGTSEAWNATAALAEAKFVHFSDWPVRKPWYADEVGRTAREPECHGEGKERDCADRDIWTGLYKAYARKRKEICGREYDVGKRESKVERRARRVPRWWEAVVR